MAVEVNSQRLPRINRELKPRVVLQLDQEEAGLGVLPTLVYGSPPCVRIDEGRMVFLRGEAPLRDEATERALLHKLREQLDLLPGRRMTFRGPDALRFADKLRRWSGDLTGTGAGLVSPGVSLIPEVQFEGGAASLKVDFRFRLENPSAGGSPRFVDAASVLQAWREGLGLVGLEGGGWAPLPAGWLEKHGHQVADLLAARGEDGNLATHAVPTAKSWSNPLLPGSSGSPLCSASSKATPPRCCPRTSPEPCGPTSSRG